MANQEVAQRQFTSPAELMRYVTVKISTSEEEEGGWTGCGTGFFYIFKVGEKYYPAVITNKHVIIGKARIAFQLHAKDDKGEPAPGPGREFTISPHPSFIVSHPEPDVDLVAIFIQPLLNVAQASGGWSAFISGISADQIPTEQEISQLIDFDAVAMVGYPSGISDSFNNSAVVRRGTVASPLDRDYQGKRQFLVDIAVFPGSSGSPILIANDGSHSTKAGMYLSNRFLLLGVLFAGHHADSHGKIIVAPAPTALEPQVVVQQMIHLGVAIKASCITDIQAELTRRLTIQTATALPVSQSG